jgi:hypothetical protein
LLAKTLNKASLSTSIIEFAIDIQEHLKDKKYVAVSCKFINNLGLLGGSRSQHKMWTNPKPNNYKNQKFVEVNN